MVEIEISGWHSRWTDHSTIPQAAPEGCRRRRNSHRPAPGKSSANYVLACSWPPPGRSWKASASSVVGAHSHMRSWLYLPNLVSSTCTTAACFTSAWVAWAAVRHGRTHRVAEGLHGPQPAPLQRGPKALVAKIGERIQVLFQRIHSKETGQWPHPQKR